MEYEPLITHAYMAYFADVVLSWLGWYANEVRLYKNSLVGEILGSRPLLLAAQPILVAIGRDRKK